MKKFFLFTLSLVLGLLTMAQVNHSGTISANETWLESAGNHYITGNITVADGVTLTIEAGCEVYFNANRRMVVQGALVADGTTDDPILFSANTVSPVAGYWRFIYFQGADAGSIMDYCTVEYGGGSNGAILFRNSLSNVTVSNTTVSHSASYGVRLLNGADNPSISDCSFDNCANYPIYTFANNVTNLTGVLSFTNNTPNAIYVRGQNMETGVWYDHGVPFVINGNCTVLQYNIVVFMPGVEVRFNGNNYFRVLGEFIANGSETDHVLFTSNQTTPAKGDWNRIFLNGSSTTHFEYCDIEYAGSAGSALDIRNTAALTQVLNCSISNSAGLGIYSRNGSEPTITDLTVESCDDFPIRIQANAVKGISGSLSLSGNVPDKIRVDAQGINTAIWNNMGYPYVMWADMNVNDLETFTLNPGTELQFNSGARLQVYGALVADGEAANKITFTSFQDSPAAGDWEYLYFNGADAGSILDYCDIMYSGSNANGSVYINNSGTNVSISNCMIDNSASYGIRATTTSDPSISDCSISNCGDFAIRTAGDHVKSITGTMNISGNTPNAIRVDALSINTGTWLNHGVPYVMWADMNQVDANTLTLNPGVVLRFNSNARLRVYGTLIADGEESNPIVFTSNSDTPAAGDWERMFFDGADAGCIMDYCEISYGGGTNGNIHVRNSGTNLAVSNTMITNSGTNGVYLQGGSSPSFINCEVTDNTENGFYLAGACVPTFGSSDAEWNDIYNNGGYQFRNGSADVDATYVYWGTESCGGIDDLIYDDADQANLGVVNYYPYLDAGHGTPALATTWTGAALNNYWHDDGNWTNFAPCTYVDVTIPAGPVYQPVIYGPESCNNITLEAGAQLTVGTGNSLLVNGDLLLEANASGTASLLENGGLTVTGNSTAQIYIEEDRWHHFSSPMTGQTAEPFLGMLLYGHDEETNEFYNIIPEITPLEVGVGYEVWSNYPSQSVEFAGGDLNTGLVTFPITLNGSGWNFVGNPYPSAVDWDALSWQKTYIDGTVYVYDGTQYLSWNGTVGDLTDGLIPAMQGFFVRAINNGAILSVDNGARTHGTDPYKSESVENLLKLTVTGNEMYDNTFINFNEEATTGIDHNIDGFKIMGHEDAPQLFSLIGSEKMRVNVLPELKSDIIIPVGLEVKMESEYTINATELETFGAGVSIYLEDLQTEEMINMNIQPNYSFVANNGEEPHRFNIHFYKDTAIEEVLVTNTNIYANENRVYVKNTDGALTGASIIVYNVTGQKVFESRIEDSPLNKFNLNMNSGYYVVKVTSSTETLSQKVFIK